MIFEGYEKIKKEGGSEKGGGGGEIHSCHLPWIRACSGPCQVLAAPFVSKYIFQDGGIGTSNSFGGRSFIHCVVEQVEELRMFIHSDRVKVLPGFGAGPKARKKAPGTRLGNCLLK